MTTVSYPSERYPAPPTVTLDIPDEWETLSVPAVAIAARRAPEKPDFTPHVIVRVGPRAAPDQVAVVRDFLRAQAGLPPVEGPSA